LQDKLDGNREYFVLNTHWDHQVAAANNHSATLIRERLGLLAGGRPMIVMGDLNSTESSPAYRRLVGLEDPAGLQLIDAYREVTPTIGRDEATYHGYSGRTLGSRIDFVLHDGSFETLDAAIVRTNYSGRYPSDHFPVTATLRLRIPEPSDVSLLAIAGIMIGSRREVASQGSGGLLYSRRRSLA
jgi:endonuclease/exonuclease/phosphatase family metal-dependent hydrolase